MSAASAIIAPGSTIGILGGGQLGRMTALAAAVLGYRCHIFAPDLDPPAGQVAATTTRAAYDDFDALARFADSVSVVTFEFENVAVAAAEFLAGRVPVRPNSGALATASDRLREKRFLDRVGVATTAYAGVAGAAEAVAARAAIPGPAILKTNREGYDGKGQIRLAPGDDVAAAWRRLGTVDAILEAMVDFACEVSVVVARGVDGGVASYVPAENTHVDGILATTRAPARIAPAVAAEATRAARAVADGLDYVGVLALEMFVTRDGRVLANEIAPRPHNSGHWTIDGCIVSQFEQHVRAVCGLPLGDPERHSDAIMENLIGDQIERFPALVREPETRVHLYGKTAVRAGRKMGHVTRVFARGSLG
ncbi:MAG: 5-(carboxyamino)imidazole ribonucleotide synthase [Alphaproteobacteria bacterium]|nr:5-(carboxyamino)imidazole ribonucleotide synthase [Alphaproteobacteria bacterium]